METQILDTQKSRQRLIERSAGVAIGATTALAMTQTPSMAASTPLGDLSSAATTIGTLTAALAATAVLVVGVVAGFKLFRRLAG
jgi:hypothetical protein